MADVALVAQLGAVDGDVEGKGLLAAVPEHQCLTGDPSNEYQVQKSTHQ
jgi:hypothetical protein